MSATDCVPKSGGVTLCFWARSTSFLQAADSLRRIEGVLRVVRAERQRAVVEDEGPGVDQTGVDAARVAVDLVAVGALEGQLLGDLDELIVRPVPRRWGDALLLENVEIEVHADGRHPERPRICLAVDPHGIEQAREDVPLIVRSEEIVDRGDEVILHEQRQDIGRQAEHIDAPAALDGLRQLREALLIAGVAGDFHLDVRVRLRENRHRRVHQFRGRIAGGVAEHPVLHGALEAALAHRQVARRARSRRAAGGSRPGRRGRGRATRGGAPGRSCGGGGGTGGRRCGGRGRRGSGGCRRRRCGRAARGGRAGGLRRIGRLAPTAGGEHRRDTRGSGHPQQIAPSHRCPGKSRAHVV